VISGAVTGSGKTTLLNVLSSFVPSDERVVTVEDAKSFASNRITSCRWRRGRRTSKVW